MSERNLNIQHSKTFLWEEFKERVMALDTFSFGFSRSFFFWMNEFFIKPNTNNKLSHKNWNNPHKRAKELAMDIFSSRFFMSSSLLYCKS